MFVMIRNKHDTMYINQTRYREQHEIYMGIVNAADKYINYTVTIGIFN